MPDTEAARAAIMDKRRLKPKKQLLAIGDRGAASEAKSSGASSEAEAEADGGAEVVQLGPAPVTP